MTKTASKQRTETDFLCLTISAGGGQKIVSDDRSGYRYRYIVSVRSDATGANIRFDYFDSIHNYERGISQLDADALKLAFWSFVSDAQAGEEDFSEFAANFGYDPDSYQARRIHQACRRAGTKFARLFHDHREPAWVLDQLAAIGVE